ncbi:MAG: amidohydrolase/deacetylase family metallohydrolase [bacterium]|jgi:dihydroorotase
MAETRRYSLLIQGGRVLDPVNGIDKIADIGIQDGHITDMGAGLKAGSETTVIDAKGCVVTAGLVDIHTHLFASALVPDAWAGDNSIYPDGFSFRTGVTTMVDAGSAGAKNFAQFRSTVMDRAKTRVFSFVNIASHGMISDALEQEANVFDAERTAAIAKEHSDIVVGIKSAHYWKPDWLSVDSALQAGEKSSLPIMVDFGYFRKERPYWELVGEKLRPGDFSTHCFRGPVPVIDEAGYVYDYLFKARERGVLFDLGHGAGSFLFRNAVTALEQGFPPDTISTDLHVLSMNRHLMDMPTTISKLMAAGMGLAEAIERSTSIPARLIGHPELGTLARGAFADIAVWNLQEGNFGFTDSCNGLLRGRQRLTCELTTLAGEIVWDWNGRAGVEYKNLPPDAGIRENLEFLVRPGCC